MYIIYWLAEDVLYVEVFDSESKRDLYYHYSMNKNTVAWKDKISFAMLLKLQQNKVSIQEHI